MKEKKLFLLRLFPDSLTSGQILLKQCVKLLNEDEEPVIKSATTYLIGGTFSDEEFARIKSFCINPVDSRENNDEKPETLVTIYEEPADVKIFDGFISMEEDALKELYLSLNLAMTFKDFQFIQEYFAGEEKRDPSMTEIRVLDTYWSIIAVILHSRQSLKISVLKMVIIKILRNPPIMLTRPLMMRFLPGGMTNMFVLWM